jgi:hypothetical protein
VTSGETITLQIGSISVERRSSADMRRAIGCYDLSVSVIAPRFLRKRASTTGSNSDGIKATLLTTFGKTAMGW